MSTQPLTPEELRSMVKKLRLIELRLRAAGWTFDLKNARQEVRAAAYFINRDIANLERTYPDPFAEEPVDA